jgi:1-acyl-sn-glycerol-3-phosphate acyltransferase
VGSDVRDVVTGVVRRATELAAAVPRAAVDRPSGVVARALRSLAVGFVLRYHRLDLRGLEHRPEGPVLFVSHHGFGGVVDLNVVSLVAALRRMELDRPVTFLVHQVAWTLGAGPLVEAVGGRPASTESARAAFGAGHHVVVLPGGDLDAAKPHARRHEVSFHGRSGFVRLAAEHGVPVVPVVTVGAGDTLLVLDDGQRLARATRLDRLLRMKALPVSLSLPWGLNVGVVGLLPYLPLPARLTTQVLPAVDVAPDDDPAEVARSVQALMQEAVDGIVAERGPAGS